MNKGILAMIALLAVGAVLYSWQPEHDFEQTRYLSYLNEYNKPVPNGNELLYRTRIFAAFLEKMEKHNADESQTYKMGVNQFSDLTQMEFVNTYLGEFSDPEPTIAINEEVNAGYNGDIDWRKEGVVTTVKNQGQCGSCWAFAATAVHESWQIQKNHEPNTINFSEQQLVDCSGAYGNMGCNGGLASSAQKYIRDKGQVEESSYPYTAKGGSCKQDSGSYSIPEVSMVTGCPALENRLSSGTSAVRVDASNWSSYRQGIFSNCSTHTNHAVLCVGTNEDYWTIKNSWGTSWGEAGYIRLAKGNTCNVCYGPSYPIPK